MDLILNTQLYKNNELVQAIKSKFPFLLIKPTNDPKVRIRMIGGLPERNKMIGMQIYNLIKTKFVGLFENYFHNVKFKEVMQ